MSRKEFGGDDAGGEVVGYVGGMELKPKIVLGGSIVCTVAGLLVAIGLIHTNRFPGLNVLLPLGVLLGGIYMILRMFEKESRVYVDDQQKALKAAGIDLPRDQTPAKRGSILSK